MQLYVRRQPLITLNGNLIAQPSHHNLAVVHVLRGLYGQQVAIENAYIAHRHAAHLEQVVGLGLEQAGLDRVALVDMFLRLSDKWGMNFWFGLYDSGKYWDRGEYEQEVALNKRVIDEVWSRYGHYKSFAGWYISQECSRNTGKIVDLYASLGRYCKEVSGDLPTMISPYIDGSKNVSQYNASTSKENVVTLESHEREWDAIFAGIQGAVDIVAFQDGHVEYDELVDFLKVNKKLADRYGLECWTNSETFDRDMPIKFLPIKWEKLRLKMGLAAQAGYQNAITFEFSHFMSPQSAYLQAGHLYDRYKEYFGI